MRIVTCEKMVESRFLSDLESLLGTLARLFASDGAALEVALLTYSTPEIVEASYNSGWNGGTTYYTLVLHLPLKLFTQVDHQKSIIETRMSERLKVFGDSDDRDILSSVKLLPAVIDDPQWREKSQAWLSGATVTNQGRVRSDNVAPLTADGLLFRSQQEINLYKAMKSMGVSFAPLAVFIRGGDAYRRIEPDFFIVRNGFSMVVEVDGDTVHTETPEEAHARTTMLQHEGVHVERIRASECDTIDGARVVAKRLIETMEKVRTSR
jgi:hypothetical protein